MSGNEKKKFSFQCPSIMFILTKSMYSKVQKHLHQVTIERHFYREWVLKVSAVPLGRMAHIGVWENLVWDFRGKKSELSLNKTTGSSTTSFSLFSEQFSIYNSNITVNIKVKQGRIHGNPVADGWAGAARTARNSKM